MTNPLLKWGRALGLIAVAAILPTSTAAHDKAAQPESPDVPWFGVVEPQAAPGYADELGAGWGRVRFHWGYVQPEGPDQWIEAELTEVELDRELAAGRQMVGLLIGVPEWAQDSQGLPSGLFLAPDDPGNLWAAYVREAVTRYAGRIDHWIIWNEPDIWDASHPAYSWPGTVDDYVQLLRVSYLTAKGANPDAVIHLAAVSHWWDVENNRDLYFPRLLDAILAQPDAAEHDAFYDVATMHLYFDPASVYEVLEEYRGYQAERGLDKPIWLVETNAAPSQDPAWPVPEPTFTVSLLEQAAYQPQALALARAAGAERVEIYKLIDTEGDLTANPEPFGLVRADGSPRPAFTTARTAARLLADADQIAWNERGIVAQVVAQTPDTTVRMLWSRVPEPKVATIPALSDRATLVDMWGNEADLIPAGGVYRIGLYAGECQQTTGDYCMIGGPPVTIIEHAQVADELPGIQAVEAMPPLHTQTGDRPGGVGRWLGIGAAVVLLMAFEVVLRRRLFGGRRSVDESEE